MPKAHRRYSPPANVDDFDRGTDPGKLRDEWHKYVAETIAGEIPSQEPNPDDPYNYPGQRAFFDALSSEIAPAPVAWFAFPEALRRWYPDDDEDRWFAADTPVPMRCHPAVIDDEGRIVKIDDEELSLQYRQQDEYCEWFTHVENGTVTRIDFTADNPDYWEILAETDPDLAVQLYRDYISGDVKKDDLFWEYDVVQVLSNGGYRQVGEKGKYNKHNKWNTTHGAMHLTHPANTLSAEVVLAAQATVLRESADGQPISAAAALICCASYGGVRRSSDPSIGAKVNGLIAAGKRVALADPVGLYISKLDRDSAGTWQVQRGSEADKMILRASFTPAAGSGLKYGGQIADNMLMNLYAIVEENPDGVPRRSPCIGHCCDYPNRPGIQEGFDVSVGCGDIDWHRVEASLIPYPRPPVAAEEPSLTAAERPTVVTGRPQRRHAIY